MSKYSEHPSAQGEFFNGSSLGEDDTLVLTISAYETRDLREPNGGTAEKLVLLFEEDERALTVSKERGKSLTKLFGDDMDDWVGNAVTLYVVPTPMGNGIRVKSATRPKGTAVRPRPDLAKPDDDDEPGEAAPRPKGRHAVSEKFREQFADPDYRRRREPRIRRAAANRPRD